MGAGGGGHENSNSRHLICAEIGLKQRSGECILRVFSPFMLDRGLIIHFRSHLLLPKLTHFRCA